jgi:hypothetical protein
MTRLTRLNLGLPRTNSLNFQGGAQRDEWRLDPASSSGAHGIACPLKTTVLIISSGVAANTSRSVRNAIWAIALRDSRRVSKGGRGVGSTALRWPASIFSIWALCGSIVRRSSVTVRFQVTRASVTLPAGRLPGVHALFGLSKCPFSVGVRVVVAWRHRTSAPGHSVAFRNVAIRNCLPLLHAGCGAEESRLGLGRDRPRMRSGGAERVAGTARREPAGYQAVRAALADYGAPSGGPSTRFPQSQRGWAQDR